MLAWNVVAGPCPDVPFDGYNRAMNSRYTFMVIIAPALPHRRGLLRLIAAPAIYIWKQVRIGKHIRMDGSTWCGLQKKYCAQVPFPIIVGNPSGGGG